jgi:hypothetical protein
MNRSMLHATLPLAALLLAGCASGPLFEGPPPIAPEQVVAMAKKGDTAANIIGELQKSRTVYSLTASQFAQLSKDGVPDAVLDYMQQTHLKEIERQARKDAQFDAWFHHGWYGHPWHATPRVVYVRPRTKGG